MTTLTIVCVGLGGYWFTAHQVEKYTATEPVELPTVEYAPAKMELLEAQIESFTQAVEDEKPPPKDLVLTAEDINALLSKNEQLRGRVLISIENGQVVGDVSVPTDTIPGADAIPGADGRFFNAKARFDVSLEDGVMNVMLVDAEVKGDKVPDAVLRAFSKENLAKKLNKDPEAAKWLERFEKLSIEDDKLVLTPLRTEKELSDLESSDDVSGIPQLRF